MTLEERLAEIEGDFPGTDFLDVAALLRAAGYTYHAYAGTHLFRNVAWGSMYTFPDGWRSVPVSYLQRIVREIRANLIRFGQTE